MPAIQTISAAPGQAVEFIPIAGPEYVAFLWNFGDGNTSTQKQPTHTYSAIGSFSVSLTATTARGEQQSKNKSSFSLVGGGGPPPPHGGAWDNNVSWDNNVNWS